jgi:hypothetical protein
MFAITFGEDSVAEIDRLRAAERRRLLDAIEKQLTYEPAETTRRKKMLTGLVPPWEHGGRSGSFGSAACACFTTWMNRLGSWSFELSGEKKERERRKSYESRSGA